MTYTSPLYCPQFEHDACGIGAVVDIRGRKSYDTVDSALKIVEKLEHRAGKDAAGETGDGVGLLLQIPHKLFQRAAGELGFELGGERDYGAGMFFFPQDRLKRAQAKKITAPMPQASCSNCGQYNGEVYVIRNTPFLLKVYLYNV